MKRIDTKRQISINGNTGKKCHGYLAVEKLHLPLIEKRLFFKKIVLLLKGLKL